MTGHPPRSRRGITLLEILISIMILAVGMVSLATLFPLGLLRLRDATRNSRSTLLYRNAGSDIETRNLFDRNTLPFTNFYPGTATPTGYNFDPWLQDGPPTIPATATSSLDYINTPTSGPGLPVVYDPLWFAASGQGFPYYDAMGNVVLPPNNTRFGRNLGLRLGTSDTGNASSYGLQRISNVRTRNADSTDNPVGLGFVTPAFVSPDDLVLQTEGGFSAPPPGGIASTQGASPLLPDLSTGSVQNDYAYSYMFTGQQADANEYTVFDGSIVVHNNRPFALDTTGPAGERVVEGIFGYGPGGTGYGPGAAYGYSTGNPRLVLLRWSSSEPDPEVAVGSWIADVTYEYVSATSISKASGQIYPMQRCYWYRVAKRSVPADDATGLRSMQVTLTSPVRARTLMNSGALTPVYTNAALICPSVVNVFPRVIYTRN